MAWLEITLNTPQGSVDSLATALTGLGFADLCIEDQQEFETFLEENREYWDYIDEDLEKKLQGLSRVKLYLEDSQEDRLAVLKAFAQEKHLPITVAPLPETDWGGELEGQLSPPGGRENSGGPPLLAGGQL